ncbi:alpha/beta hydrolase [Geomonas sp. Red69]|uniref:alpha/beta fold hydrolase n=1 Tax=Geomonas diazotrophica TaxID=2843197 RepID=UPI001C124D62|nr:alpha/beta hydrolase [Geomonas diazotrophica]MBU5637383.1 alpha/beta hydrolase [Geomonas diazotrophica]
MLYLICARKVKNGEFVGEPGRISYIEVVPDAKSYGPSDVIKESIWFDRVSNLADGDPNPTSTSPKGDVLIFVHGYNNTIETVLWRQRQLQNDLEAEGWKGIIVGFDWPSEDSTLNYLEDRSDAAEVAVSLVTNGISRLARGQQSGCQTNVHLLGHSTGAYVVMEAFAQAEKNGALFKQPWRVGQVAFIGGDVASSTLRVDSEWAAPLFRRCMRLSNYSNPNDKVLAVSNAKRLGVEPRAGRVGLPENPHPKAVNINCGEYFSTLDPDRSTFTGTFNHSWHIGNRVFARDLAMVIEGGIDRLAIPTRKVKQGELVLQDSPRPMFQSKWDKTNPVK